MKIDDLISSMETEFDELEAGSLKPETNFRDLPQWSSMHALIIIALVDTEFGVVLSGEDLMSVSTVSELFDVIENKKNN